MPDRDPMIGQTISHYRIERKLGEGGMGIVYKAVDLRLNRTVALKFFSPRSVTTPDMQVRFLAEAQAAAALDHPSICAIHEIDKAAEGTFIAMAYVEGENLRQKLSTGPLPLEDVLRYAIQVAEGLQEAHRKGIVHRDIKSANIVITPRGRVKILDFGLAEFTAAVSPLPSAAIIGTTAYMSPEQAQGLRDDHRTDIWSLGVVLYEALARQLPFQGDYDQAVLYSILNEAPKPLSLYRRGLPKYIENIVAKALAKAPADRYQSAAEILADLKRARANLQSRGTARPKKSTPSIAVLPFVNLSSQASTEYFSDGLTDELIVALTQLKDLRVASRTSAFQFRGKAVNIREVGEKLNVTSVLEGSVRAAGKRLRVSVHLINVANGYHLWSERYDRQMEDVLDVQEEIAGQIVRILKVKLSGRSEPLFAKRYTENAKAYQLYLQGRYYLNEEVEHAFEKARTCFELALGEDPQYAPAYSGLADYHTMVGFYGVAPPKNAWSEAKNAALKALELDSGLAEAHSSLGTVLSYYDWDWEGAELEFCEALKLHPGHAGVRYHYGDYLIKFDRWDEAMAQMRQASELDPLSASMSSGIALVHYFHRRYSDAIDACQQAVRLNPNYPVAHSIHGLAHLGLHNFGEALQSLHRANQVSGDSPDTTALLALTHASAGQTSEAEALLDRLNEAAKQKYVSPAYLSLVYLGLGQLDAAFECLEQAYQSRDTLLAYLRVLPLFDAARQDPRFDMLLEKCHLDFSGTGVWAQRDAD